MINHLLKIFANNPLKEAIVWNNKSYNYIWLSHMIDNFSSIIRRKDVKMGDVVVLNCDFSPCSIALIIALIKQNCTIVPLTIKNSVQKKEYCHVAQAQHLIEIDSSDEVSFFDIKNSLNNKLLLSLKRKRHPGLVIFSSGSTGKSKASVHDFIPLLEKFKVPKKSLRLIAFLLFDHIGGINTLFYTLFNAGCLIITGNRSTSTICASIERYKANALTTTPTFLNLLLLSGDIDKHDLTSLNVINYGTEVMPEATLQKLHKYLPNVRLSQAYGLSEVGVLPVRSKSSDSLFIELDGEGFETRIVNGLLEIKSKSSMLGYLNSEQPFTNDGWFQTGDAVEVNGKYLRILGRSSELINVGGEKVYPAEIENILQQIPGVEQVSVSSENNAIMGQIVVAKIKLKSAETLTNFRVRLHEFCRSKLPKYKIPQKITLTQSSLHNERFKTIRKLTEKSNEIHVP